MKHRTLVLCLFALVTLAITSVAHADTFNYSFSGAFFSGSGTFTATEEGATNIYDVSAVTGTVSNWGGSSAITSLAGLNTFSGNDNKLIYPGVVPGWFLPVSYFDSKGVSFGLADGDYINLNDSWGLELAVGGAPKGFSLTELDTVDVSRNSPVPEPSSLALFGTGIFGIAGAMRLKLRIG